MVDWVSKELRRSYARASRAGEARLATEPVAKRAYYSADQKRLVVELRNGVILMLPPKLLQGLKGASAAQLMKVELTPLGTGLHCLGRTGSLRVGRGFIDPVKELLAKNLMTEVRFSQ